MKTVHITETFDGYPAGKKRVSFTAGQEIEVSDAFAALIIKKGHARAAAPAAEPKKDVKA